ncbi:hypothetical protein ATANTOWER_019407 [Ataeniobius toweri]|uniref:Secreted protein n=1 Tax=Ataeniobius toweri TaxID=208326 RepID=A0ABU7B7V9_9TELE|nr:hypothetical protein [Ataeniobius toweri]
MPVWVKVQRFHSERCNSVGLAFLLFSAPLIHSLSAVVCLSPFRLSLLPPNRPTQTNIKHSFDMGRSLLVCVCEGGGGIRRLHTIKVKRIKVS